VSVFLFACCKKRKICFKLYNYFPLLGHDNTCVPFSTVLKYLAPTFSLGRSYHSSTVYLNYIVERLSDKIKT
jgi:hypothetical protein